MHDPTDHNHDDHSFDGFSIEEIKKNFKVLGEELETGGTPVNEIIDDTNEESQPKAPPFFRGYIPTIKDYLARATTHEECEEIIKYCLKRGEITQEEADQYLYRLSRGGPRAFGTRRPGYYDQKL